MVTSIDITTISVILMKCGPEFDDPELWIIVICLKEYSCNRQIDVDDLILRIYRDCERVKLSDLDFNIVLASIEYIQSDEYLDSHNDWSSWQFDPNKLILLEPYLDMLKNN